MPRTPACLLILALWATASPAAESWLAQARYQLHQRITLSQVQEDASGLAFDPIRQRLWLVTDNGALHELDNTGRWLRSIQLMGFNDPEGIAWLGSDQRLSQLAISEERRGQIVRINVDHSTKSLDFSHAELMASTGKQGSNHGIEGLSWDTERQQLYVVSEQNPQAVYRLQQGSLQPLWKVGLRNFWREPLDYAGVAYAARSKTLLIVSDRNREVREYSMEGKTLAKLAVDASDPEGIALAPDGSLYICSEPNLLLIYKPQL